MKCQTHNKHGVLWQDPCVKKRVPRFWERIDKIAWLVGLEASITSLGKVKVQQTKEKFGSAQVYYSFSSDCKLVEDIVDKTRKRTKYSKNSYKTPKFVFKAMERQRRLNPDIAHYIYNIPYKCNCKDDFWCKEYDHVNLLQKVWDKSITKALEFYGNHSSRWGMLRGGFVLYGKKWGTRPWQRVKKSLRKPF